ncbi:hypothetical protein X777_04443 [Ooceraea biroi]|uniref:Uncharacterized protein n=1 Tax=Ooceraea biroi TaxID=2015173 RepID=A0A026WFT9_OOCBI|nr:hypothetical protein X777_04443 [Ooceraea biroi]
MPDIAPSDNRLFRSMQHGLFGTRFRKSSQIGVARGFPADPPAAGHPPPSVVKQEEEEEQEGGARKSRGERERERRGRTRAPWTTMRYIGARLVNLGDERRRRRCIGSCTPATPGTSHVVGLPSTAIHGGQLLLLRLQVVHLRLRSSRSSSVVASGALAGRIALDCVCATARGCENAQASERRRQRSHAHRRTRIHNIADLLSNLLLVPAKAHTPPTLGVEGELVFEKGGRIARGWTSLSRVSRRRARAPTPETVNEEDEG